MNYYLKKYVGKYRVKAEIDQRTNDFCRDRNGNLENSRDIYIVCSKGTKIFHYGGNVLQAYIPSIGRGRNAIRRIYAKYINPQNVSYSKEKDGDVEKEKFSIINQDTFQSDLENNPIIFNIEETDEEVMFQFKDKNMNIMEEILKPSTFGANISPFSTKNLKKKKSVLTDYQLNDYRKITSVIPSDDKLKIKQINESFLQNKLQKELGIDYKFEIKKEGYKTLDYISFKGVWKEYLEYLQEKVDELYGDKN